MNNTRSSLNASRTASAISRCALWIGSNVPPMMPSRRGSFCPVTLRFLLSGRSTIPATPTTCSEQSAIPHGHSPCCHAAPSVLPDIAASSGDIQSAFSFANLACAIDQILGAGQFFQPHRAAGMKLLCTDADLSPKAELKAVGKTG